MKLDRIALVTTAIFFIIGLVLRLRGANGDLWIDEMWSFRLLEDVRHPLAIFVALMHDNNHPLNSLWLYYVGPSATPVMQRGLSIILGTASVLATAMLYARQPRAAFITATALIASSYAVVHFGSEARGYAGMILFSIAGFAALERSLIDKASKSRWILAACAMLGILSHLGMAQTLGVLGLWTSVVFYQRKPRLSAAIISTFSVFWPTALLLSLVAACYAIGISMNGYHFGAFMIVSITQSLISYGEFLRMTVAIPGLGPFETVWCVGLGTLATAIIWGKTHSRMLLYPIAVILLPVLMIGLKQPNLNFPRYFLVSGIFTLFWISDLIGMAWENRKPAIAQRTLRGAVALFAVLFLFQNSLNLRDFFHGGRSHMREMMATMTANGDASYAALTPRPTMQVDFYAASVPHRLESVSITEDCERLPDWVIVETWRTSVPILCNGRLQLEHAETFPIWGLSGEGFILMRRVKTPS